jgi:hypothetical protein
VRRITLAALAATFALTAVPGAATAKPKDPSSAPIVCNEAENSFRGGYEVTGGPVDPNPPAFLRGSQMKIGNGAGVVNAAAHSPALRLCGPEGSGPTDPTDPTDPTGPTDPPSDGGGDGGPIVTVN